MAQHAQLRIDLTLPHCIEPRVAQLDALRARHAELQAENQHLREALARKLGHRRTDPPADRCRAPTSRTCPQRQNPCSTRSSSRAM